MKNFLLLFVGILLVFGCKKETKDKNFTPSDVSGTSTVNGHLSKTVISPDGNGGWTNTTSEAASDVKVMITISRNSLYPNSSAQGADVYTGSSDDKGNYTIPVKSNASGVIAKITIDGFTGTQDTLINGTYKKGLYSTFAGTAVTANLVMGQNHTLNHRFSAVAVATPTNSNLLTGTAQVTGSVGIEYLQEVIIGNNPPFYNPVIVPFPAGHKVYLRLDKDPSTYLPKVYETTTDGNGYYRFTINTVAGGTPDFNQDAMIWINDLEATRDTLKADKTLKKGGRGVYQRTSLLQQGLFNNTIRNANYLAYTSFVAD